MDADCIIVGAGAAGLAAAAQLARGGARAVILEARDRIGGRAYTRELNGEPYELGAEFIHGPAPETRELLAAIGERALPRDDGSSWLQRDDGTLERQVDDDIFDWGMGVLDHVPQLREDLSLDAYLQRYARGRDDEAAMVRMFAEGFDAADPAIASVRGIYDEWHSGVDSISARPSPGYAPIMDELLKQARAHGAELHVDRAASAVRVRDGRVEVTCVNGTEFAARCAIVTLPVAILNAGRIVFDPELPSWKRSAIASLETGPVVRVVLQFHAAFWQTLDDGRYRDATFFRPSNDAFGVYWTQYPQHASSVVAWAGGPRAERLLERGSDALIAIAARGFGQLFGAPDLSLAQLQRGDLHDWSADRYALGAYSYLRTGGGRARTTLAEPIDDTLFFAGEATAADGQGGTVNGAIASGYRAASEVFARVLKKG